MSGLKISLATVMAVHVLALMASEDRDAVHSVSALARRLGLSEAHLAKVLQQLARSGLVRPVRGAHGGSCLAAPVEELTLRRVYEAMEGSVGGTRCCLGKKTRGAICALVGAVADANSAALAELEKVNVTSIAPCEEKEK